MNRVKEFFKELFLVVAFICLVPLIVIVRILILMAYLILFVLLTLVFMGHFAKR